MEKEKNSPQLQIALAFLALFCKQCELSKPETPVRDEKAPILNKEEYAFLKNVITETQGERLMYPEYFTEKERAGITNLYKKIVLGKK